MDVDTGLGIVGNFGWLQAVVFVANGLAFSISALQMTSMPFTIDQSIDFYCNPPPGFTANQTTPLIYKDGGYVRDGCNVYGVSNGTLTGDIMKCQNGWKYVAEYGETSSVTDLNLVCDSGVLASLLMSLQFVGVALGSVVMGQAGDTFGRRLVAMVSTAFIALFGTVISFTWNVYLMAVLRLCLGFVLPGCLIECYVRMIEMFTTEKRLLGHILAQNFWAVGILLIALFAFLIPNWRHLQLVISLGILPFGPLLWYSYESLRWLVQKDRLQEAGAILERIAKSKNIHYPPGFQLTRKPQKNINHDSQGNLSDSGEEVEAMAKSLDEKRAPLKKYNVLDLFRTRVLMKNTLIIYLCWFVMDSVYYALLFYSTLLAGNKYLNFFLMALAETPVYFIDFFIVRRFGRKRPLVFFFFASGVACFLVAFLPFETASGTNLTALIVASAMVGKFYSCATFELTILVGAEVFPTVLRSIGTGSASTIGRVGAIVAPFVVYLKEVVYFLPMTILGVSSLVVCVCVTMLPETKDKPLPETYEDSSKEPRV
ncbi:organic cation transporter protein-like [Asterias rubens]|uniref:organic cation transporter protein-like n=1 Tax=Asterias rubens TaxID=7604 RepID=UPI001455B8D6|nr:organic cation transporter protein-like [Asterias rubens]